ncbi:hypothetical protein POJ06DRAFT_125988 [Lipomyces tetrasporus]|uniref:Uncharacterized protein n=1 Tax=Lipomyces tetrasporus TaxID=54092 RepID=A0AAD7QSP0_9ASCO|nr:uncharacterized protein POJ06DRAFT_125988 [Lipomyces tetrasporus]KAJ8099002.1 hypothetical protein POJ06DRAFT_125988 [Lipomyces tetrasporus]
MLYSNFTLQFKHFFSNISCSRILVCSSIIWRLELLDGCCSVAVRPASRILPHRCRDQNSKTVRVFPRNAKRWSSDEIFSSFTADPPFWNDDWNNVSDVKIRKIGTYGWIAMMTASGGEAGIVNISKEKRKTTPGDLMWQATPAGNPHAIERIPYNGASVVASSESGKLTLYVPQDSDDINDFDNIKTSPYSYDVPAAHGVLWDPNGSHDQDKGFLWVTGKGYLYKYKVTGKGPATRLELDTDPIELPKGGLGHDLQPDYTDPHVLLMTDTYGAYRYNAKTEKWKTIRNQRKLKSFARHWTGEYIWIKGDSSDMGHYVTFSDNPADIGSSDEESRGWEDAKFYKARIYSPRFE